MQRHGLRFLILRTSERTKGRLYTGKDCDSAYLYLGAVEHQPAEARQLGDVGEGLRLKAVAGGQVELLQPGAGLRDDLQAGVVQEVAARQLQADQAGATGLHEAEGDEKRDKSVSNFS